MVKDDFNFKILKENDKTLLLITSQGELKVNISELKNLAGIKDKLDFLCENIDRKLGPEWSEQILRNFETINRGMEDVKSGNVNEFEL